MCGLAGRFNPYGLAPAPGWGARAAALLAHRGPDGSGHYADEQCELVHRRLALIDLSPTGAQPMTNETGTVLVVFNGEIYNHVELRAGLTARGHRFRGTSDTEVLVHLYEERGAEMAEALRGIFAFAVYDIPARRLLLARDRFGVKPLFYARHDGQWVFASEIKAITALPGFQPTLDRQACFDFLGLGYVPEPATGFVEIHALPVATTLTIDTHGARFHTYHRLTVAPDPTLSLHGAADAVAERLLAAVAGQSRADVPVAALLSGGIDSSLVVAAHQRAAGPGVRTFSVRFPDQAHDESAAAHAVARHCGTEHQTVELEPRAITPDAVFDLFAHFDQPFADTSLIPTYWISAAIRERGIICTLSGDGGDEAFGGYQSFWRANRLARLMAWPAWARATLGTAGRALAPVTRDWGRRVAKAAALARAGRDDSAAVLAGLANYLTEEQKAQLVAAPAREGLEPVATWFNGFHPAAAPDLDELSRRMTHSMFAVSLPSDMLRKVDMMSMRASIEVRVPLLDEDLVALGTALPHTLKTDGHTGKRVLRAVAARWLPPAVAAHPKHGFSIPLDVMAPQGLHDAVGDLLLGTGARTRHAFDGPLVSTWLDRFRRARAGARGGAISRGGLYQRVFTLVALELWMRAHALSW